jgi:hypothetical protein
MLLKIGLVITLRSLMTVKRAPRRAPAQTTSPSASAACASSDTSPLAPWHRSSLCSLSFSLLSLDSPHPWLASLVLLCCIAVTVTLSSFSLHCQSPRSLHSPPRSLSLTQAPGRFDSEIAQLMGCLLVAFPSPSRHQNSLPWLHLYPHLTLERAVDSLRSLLIETSAQVRPPLLCDDSLSL